MKSFIGASFAVLGVLTVASGALALNTGAADELLKSLSPSSETVAEPELRTPEPTPAGLEQSPSPIQAPNPAAAPVRITTPVTTAPNKTETVPATTPAPAAAPVVVPPAPEPSPSPSTHKEDEDTKSGTQEHEREDTQQENDD